MATDPQFFHDLAWVIVAAVVGGALAWLARQPVLLGYLVGGVLVGRFTPGPTVSDTHTFELFAEIGVVLLMFSIGIEFTLRDLLRVRWVALLGGPLGIVLTAALGAGAWLVLGWPPLQGLAIGLVISVASTMVLVRLLIDRGELHTRHGQVLIGISLIEDLAAVALTILLPALGTRGAERPLAVLVAIGKAIAVLGPVLLLAVRGVPPLMRRVARTQNDELFLLVGKAGVRTAIVLLFGYPLATAARVGIGLAQIGEFSFVLVQVARGAGLIGDEVYNTTLAASLLTILLNALLVRFVPDWLEAARLGRARRAPSCCAASGVWAARSARRSRRSASHSQ